MKRLMSVMMLGMLSLTACNTDNGVNMLATRTIVDPQVNDGSSQVTVTKTVTAAIPATDKDPAVPAKVSYANGASGAAEILFYARPGSEDVYLTGYRVTKDTFYTASGSYENTYNSSAYESVRIYVPSGWTCPEASSSQSCNMYTPTGALRSDVSAANGLPSTAYLLDISSALIDDAVAQQSTVTRSMNLEFIGTTGSGKSVTIPVTGIRGAANFVVQSN